MQSVIAVRSITRKLLLMNFLKRNLLKELGILVLLWIGGVDAVHFCCLEQHIGLDLGGTKGGAGVGGEKWIAGAGGKNNARLFSRCRTARRRMKGSQTL